jgi:uncharacterized membrane protein YfbV (UPF0208 family)
VQELIGAVLGAITASGVIGAGLWWTLGKGLEGRLAKVLEAYKLQLSKTLEEHKAQLAGELHKRNTVFVRLDQKRADSLLAVDAAVGECSWFLLDFSPKFSFKTDADAGFDAMTWCFQFQDEAQKALQCELRNSLLLPEDLEKDIVGWYFATQTLAQELLGAFVAVRTSNGYNALADQEKRAHFVRAKDALLGEGGPWENYGKATRDLQAKIRKAFSSVGD